MDQVTLVICAGVDSSVTLYTVPTHLLTKKVVNVLKTINSEDQARLLSANETNPEWEADRQCDLAKLYGEYPALKPLDGLFEEVDCGEGWSGDYMDTSTMFKGAMILSNWS